MKETTSSGVTSFLNTLVCHSKSLYTVNPLLSPTGGLFFQALLRGGGGGLFNLAKRITCSKNTVVRDRVDLHIVQLKSL